MFVSEDGYVNGSIDNSKLDEVEAKSPEAKARLEQLKAERDAANTQAAADAERLAKLHEAQSLPGQVRETVTTQARSVVTTPQGAAFSDPAADQKTTDQKAADQEKTSARRSSSSDKG